MFMTKRERELAKVLSAVAERANARLAAMQTTGRNTPQAVFVKGNARDASLQLRTIQGWLSKQTYEFLTATIVKFGKPTRADRNSHQFKFVQDGRVTARLCRKRSM